MLRSSLILYFLNIMHKFFLKELREEDLTWKVITTVKSEPIDFVLDNSAKKI
jgi:hypothetical protein